MNVTTGPVVKRSDSENKANMLMAAGLVASVLLLLAGVNFISSYRSSGGIEEQVNRQVEATIAAVQTQQAVALAAAVTVTPTATMVPTLLPVVVQPTPLPTYDLAEINAKLAILYGQAAPATIEAPRVVEVPVSVPVTVTEIVTVTLPPVEYKPTAAPGEAKLCLYVEGITGIYVGPPGVAPLGMAGNTCIPLRWGGPVGEWKVTLTR